MKLSKTAITIRDLIIDGLLILFILTGLIVWVGILTHWVSILFNITVTTS